MGNAGSSKVRDLIRVIDVGNGSATEYLRSIRVAELMLENPGSFVCDSRHLKVRSRIPGLPADEELECRQLYFLLPMDMLYSVLTEEEMAVVSRLAVSAVRRRRRRSSGSKNIGRIFPVFSDFCMFPAEEAKEVIKLQRAGVDAAAGEMIVCRQRSWKPALDTIEEVP